MFVADTFAMLKNDELFVKAFDETRGQTQTRCDAAIDAYTRELEKLVSAEIARFPGDGNRCDGIICSGLRRLATASTGKWRWRM